LLPHHWPVKGAETWQELPKAMRSRDYVEEKTVDRMSIEGQSRQRNGHHRSTMQLKEHRKKEAGNTAA